jgi:hypothetical protein
MRVIKWLLSCHTTIEYCRPLSTTENPALRDDEDRLTADTITLARQYGRYGYC